MNARNLWEVGSHNCNYVWPMILLIICPIIIYMSYVKWYVYACAHIYFINKGGILVHAYSHCSSELIQADSREW